MILSSAVVEPFGLKEASKIGQTFGDDLMIFEHSVGGYTGVYNTKRIFLLLL